MIMLWCIIYTVSNETLLNKTVLQLVILSSKYEKRKSPLSNLIIALACYLMYLCINVHKIYCSSFHTCNKVPSIIIDFTGFSRSVLKISAVIDYNGLIIDSKPKKKIIVETNIFDYKGL